MTPRQKAVLDFISAAIARDGVAPSLTEIGAAFGLTSKNSVHKVVSALVRDGHLVRGRRAVARNIALPGAALGTVSTADLRRELDRRAARHG